MHLPTLDIRVKQKGNRAIKWETHFGILLKSGKKIKNKKLPRPGIEPGTLQYVWFSAAGKQAILILCSTLAKKDGRRPYRGVL